MAPPRLPTKATSSGSHFVAAATIIVTVNGKPDAVLLDAEVLEKKLKPLNLALLLVVAEADVKDGRVRNTRNFMEELKNGAKIQPIYKE